MGDWFIAAQSDSTLRAHMRCIHAQELMKTLDMSMQSSKVTLDDLEQKEAEYFVAAEQCFERAIKFDSTDPEFLFHRGKLFFHQVRVSPCLC